MEPDGVLSWTTAYTLVPIQNSLIRSLVDLIELVFFCNRGVVGSGAGLRGLEVLWTTVMAQFIFTTPNLSHEERPRMVVLGVSATYQQI